MRKQDPFARPTATGSTPEEQKNLAEVQKQIPLRDLVEAALIVSGITAALVGSVCLVSFLVK